MNADHLARLQGTALFGGLTIESLECLMAGACAVQRTAGELFAREGDVGDKVYLLESGRAEVLKEVDQQPRRLAVLGPGDCFGEMAVLGIRPRSATVRALDECHALEIPTAALFALYEHDLEQFALLSMNMGREVSRRLSELEDHLGDDPAVWKRD